MQNGVSSDARDGSPGSCTAVHCLGRTRPLGCWYSHCSRRPPIGGGFEDPHLYFDSKNNLHLLFHAFGNEPAVVNDSCRGTLTSAHAYSSDGFHWFVSPGVPYPAAVTTGSNMTVGLGDGLFDVRDYVDCRQMIGKEE